MSAKKMSAKKTLPWVRETLREIRLLRELRKLTSHDKPNLIRLIERQEAELFDAKDKALFCYADPRKRYEYLEVQKDYDKYHGKYQAELAKVDAKIDECETELWSIEVDKENKLREEKRAREEKEWDSSSF